MYVAAAAGFLSPKLVDPLSQVSSLLWLVALRYGNFQRRSQRLFQDALADTGQARTPSRHRLQIFVDMKKARIARAYQLLVRWDSSPRHACARAPSSDCCYLPAWWQRLLSHFNSPLRCSNDKCTGCVQSEDGIFNTNVVSALLCLPTECLV